MDETIRAFEVFLPKEAEDYQRAGEQVLAIAALQASSKNSGQQKGGIQLVEDAAQWQHGRPPSFCRVTRHQETVFQLDVIAHNTRNHFGRISSWLFGLSVGLVPVIDERVPINILDKPAKAVQAVLPKAGEAMSGRTLYKMPTGDTRERFVAELTSFLIMQKRASHNMQAGRTK
jgi:hypothetical protein